MKQKLKHGAWLVCSIASAGCRQELPSEKILESDPPVIAAIRPPPLSGGTLLVTRDESQAIAADPERDRVLVIDLAGADVREVALQAGDEPGRSVEDGQGRVHVALRRSGEVVSIDLATATILGRRPACGSPQGIAYQPDGDAIHVACADGQLVTLDAEPGGVEQRRVFVEPDLRDVLLRGSELLVTTFRSAELLRLDPGGAVIERTVAAASHDDFFGTDHEPHVAWRTVAAPGGPIVMVHQLELSTMVDLTPPPPEEEFSEGGDGAYANMGCEDRLVRPAVSVLDATGGARELGGFSISGLRMMIDLAVSADGARLAVIDVGTRVMVELNTNDPFASDGCGSEDTGVSMPIDQGTPIANAFAGARVLVQTREPASVIVFDGVDVVSVISLGGDSRADTGFDLFYNLGPLPTASGLACASCHPEGRDDGHTWDFSDVGLRRSQSLAGTIAGTAPFHWTGEFDDLDGLMNEVFTNRMVGPRQSEPRVLALQSWIESVPPVRAAATIVDGASVEHGQELFVSEEVGCSSCHSGPALTNNENVDIGRGESLQVPSLIGIGTRAPYMHDGCAATLMDRFDPACGGGDEHGNTSQLDEAALRDLVAFMSTL